MYTQHPYKIIARFETSYYLVWVLSIHSQPIYLTDILKGVILAVVDCNSYEDKNTGGRN